MWANRPENECNISRTVSATTASCDEKGTGDFFGRNNFIDGSQPDSDS